MTRSSLSAAVRWGKCAVPGPWTGSRVGVLSAEDNETHFYRRSVSLR